MESVFSIIYLFYVALVELVICTRENPDVNKLHLFCCKYILHHISFNQHYVQIIETKAKSVEKYYTYVFNISSAHKVNTNLIKGDCYSYTFDVF